MGHQSVSPYRFNRYATRAANPPRAIRPDRRVMQPMDAGGQKAGHCRTAEQSVSSQSPLILRSALQPRSTADEGIGTGRQADTEPMARTISVTVLSGNCGK